MDNNAESKARYTIRNGLSYLESHPIDLAETTYYYAHCANLAVSYELLYMKSNDPAERAESIKYANIVKKRYLEFYESHVVNRRRLEFLRKGTSDTKSFLQASVNALDVLARLGDFDAFAIAVEFYRPNEDCFYMPRRKNFMHLQTVSGEYVNIIKDAQDFVDGRLDFLFFAMPQRCGKTTFCAFILVYRAFKNLSKSTFGLGHSTELANHFFDLMCLFMGVDGATVFRTLEIFSGHKVHSKNKEYRELDIDEPHPFPTFAYKSIDGQITGSTEASLTAYADDLIKEPNEVVNTQIADNIWVKVNTYIFGRKKKGVPILGAATLWGDNCPFTRYIAHLKKTDPHNPRIVIRQFAWCDSKGESQFDYLFDLGFDTKHFLNLQATMEAADKALWEAMYLSNPIPREGRPLSNLDFYGALPEEKPSFVALAIDAAIARAGDYWAAPFGYFYEKTRQIFIEDVVYTNQGTDVSMPQTVEKCLIHKPIQIEVEEKEATTGRIKSGLGETLRKLLSEKGITPYVRSHTAAGQQSKMVRILNQAAPIKGIPVEGFWTMHFNQNKYDTDPEYRQFVRGIMNWSEAVRAQANQIDDAPDSCAMMLSYLTTSTGVTVRTVPARKLYG